MRITLITGFLGAGKTTFLRRFLRTHAKTERAGAIINDLSQLEVDGELIRMGHVVSEDQGTLVSLRGGSISGDRRNEFVEAVGKMRDHGIAHLLIETSGGSDPEVVARTVHEAFHGSLHAVATFVDARMLLRDYDEGMVLLERLKNSDARGEEALMISQLRTANVLVLTKLDLVPQDKLTNLLRVLHVINPGATLAGCAHGALDPAILRDVPAYEPSKQEVPPQEVDVTCIGSTVISDPRPLHPQRFYDLYRERLGAGLFRSKGFIWLASRPAQVLLWNQAGGAIGLEFLATWRAAILESDSRLLPEEKQLLRDQLANRHPVYGDRSCELTLIGHARDRQVFGRELMECFCTEDEIARWQSGGSFPDPWPANLKVM